MTLGFAPEPIGLWPIERLRPYAQNAKTHGPDQIARIAASIAEFGWTVPVLVADDGEVIAGHGRILAATELGLTEAPVIVLALAVMLFLLSPWRAGERAGRMAERLEITERADAVHHRMLEAAARRPRRRDELARRLRDGRF